MRFSTLCDPGTAAAIGADWLEAQLAPAGDFGRRALARETVFVRGDELRAQAAIARIAELALALTPDRVTALRVALRAAPDPSGIVARATVGDVLDDVDLFELARFLDAQGRVAALLAGTELAALAPPSSTALRDALGVDDPLGSAGGDAVATARADAAAANATFDQARDDLATRVARALGREALREDEFIVMRDAIPESLPPDVRVVHEAPAYLACALVLDEPALAAAGARDAALQRLASAEEAARATLTTLVRDESRVVARTIDRLGDLDVLLAKVAFAQRFAGAIPEIIDARAVVLTEATFSPLAEALAGAQRTYVPISFAIEGTCVLTGPNMGGKSAALRTAGFAALCVAAGVPVPALEARVALFDRIAWIGIGGESTSEALLSSFGREIVSLGTFLDAPVAAPLVLVDEFARTTTPHEARALVLALIGTLAVRRACALVATHLGGIAAAAGVPHLAIAGVRTIPERHAGESLERTLERLGEAMDYSVLRVEPGYRGNADAIALAEMLGLDPGFVARARDAL